MAPDAAAVRGSRVVDVGQMPIPPPPIVVLAGGTRLRRPPRSREVGWLLDRRSWGRGFATEAGGAAIDYAFRVLGAEKVISLIRPENHASIRVAQRLGESYQGTVEIAGALASVYAVRRFHPGGLTAQDTLLG